MNNKNRNLMIGGALALLLSLFGLSFLLKNEPEAVLPPKQITIIEDVHVPPPPPLPTPEQIAAAEAQAKASADTALKADKEAELAKLKAKVVALKPVKPAIAAVKPVVKNSDPPMDQSIDRRDNSKKELTKKLAEPAVAESTDPTKPKEVRFNMSQGGKKMTAEDFDAWMKAQGIRIVPAKPVEQVKPDEKKDGGG